MTKPNASSVLVLTVVAICTVMLIPDVAFSRGGGGGGGARGGGRASPAARSSGRSTTRRGPAASGSTKRNRARASGRGTRASGRSNRPSADHVPGAGHRPGTRPPGHRPGVRPPAHRPVRWHRRRNAQVIYVSDWQGMNCTKTERVDGVSYFYCKGSWWEKVYDGGDVYWVQVDKPK